MWFCALSTAKHCFPALAAVPQFSTHTFSFTYTALLEGRLLRCFYTWIMKWHVKCQFCKEQLHDLFNVGQSRPTRLCQGPDNQLNIKQNHIPVAYKSSCVWIYLISGMVRLPEPKCILLLLSTEKGQRGTRRKCYICMEINTLLFTLILHSGKSSALLMIKIHYQVVAYVIYMYFNKFWINKKKIVNSNIILNFNSSEQKTMSRLNVPLNNWVGFGFYKEKTLKDQVQ